MMSTNHHLNHQAPQANASGGNHKATRQCYRWNPYGVFCKTEVSPTTTPASDSSNTSEAGGYSELPYYRQHHTDGPNQTHLAPRCASTPLIVASGCNDSMLSRRSSESGSDLASAGMSTGSISTNSGHHAITPATESAQAQADHRRLVLQWVNYSRSLSCDERVDAVIEGLSTEVQEDMLEVILCCGETSSRLFVDLCTSERGNVVTQLLRSLKHNIGCGAEATHRFQEATATLMETHWSALTTSQFGAIALTRVFQELPPQGYQERLARLTLQTATSLALHQFGNFMVSEVLKTACRQPAHFGFVYQSLLEAWSQPCVFAQLAESRFGSHVVETMIKTAPAAVVLKLCTPLVSSGSGIDTVVQLGYHRQGNYPLQAVFRALASSSQGSALLAEAKPVLVHRLDGSDFCRNLIRAMSPPSASSSNAHKSASSAAARKGKANSGAPAAVDANANAGPAPFPCFNRSIPQRW